MVGLQQTYTVFVAQGRWMTPLFPLVGPSVNERATTQDFFRIPVPPSPPPLFSVYVSGTKGGVGLVPCPSRFGVREIQPARTTTTLPQHAQHASLSLTQDSFQASHSLGHFRVHVSWGRWDTAPSLWWLYGISLRSLLAHLKDHASIDQEAQPKRRLCANSG